MRAFTLTLLVTLLAANARAVKIDVDYPGGNVIVERMDGADVHVRPDLRDTRGNWFYWNFRVREAAGQTLRVHFTQGNPIGARGPAASIDGGKTWRWLGAESVDKHSSSFQYAVPAGVNDVRFAFAFPYQQADLEAFLARHKDNPHVRREELARTAKGRRVESLRLGRVDANADHRVALTCRHHSCESVASFALEGVMDAILSDTDDGKWLREHAEFFVVPIIDLDGVED